jgi:glycerophosphoryl diester phosphodiesterase
VYEGYPQRARNGGVSNPWLVRRVLSYAHQGGAKQAPSSTLYAIEQALVHGVSAIELDVHATKDGDLVVCHDPTLDRTTNGSGRIAEQHLADIEMLDSAYYFVEGHYALHDRPSSDYVLRGRARSDRRFRVATLVEVLESFPGVTLNLDIKETAPMTRPYEETLATMLRAYKRTDDVIVTSFYDRATSSFKGFAPEIATSAGLNATTGFVQALRSQSTPDPSIGKHVALQVPAYVAGSVLVDVGFVDFAHANGLAVHVWTVDEVEEIERLVAAGVDGIMTDFPSVLVPVLDRLGVTYRP